MPAYKVATLFFIQENKWTNKVFGLETDLFRRYDNKEDAIKDGKIISIWLSIPHEIEHHNIKPNFKERGASKTEQAKTIEKSLCPETREERALFIDSLKTEKGGFTAESAAKIGVFYPLPKGWIKNAIDNGW